MTEFNITIPNWVIYTVLSIYVLKFLLQLVLEFLKLKVEEVAKDRVKLLNELEKRVNKTN